MRLKLILLFLIIQTGYAFGQFFYEHHNPSEHDKANGEKYLNKLIEKQKMKDVYLYMEDNEHCMVSDIDMNIEMLTDSMINVLEKSGNSKIREDIAAARNYMHISGTDDNIYAEDDLDKQPVPNKQNYFMRDFLFEYLGENIHNGPIAFQFIVEKDGKVSTPIITNRYHTLIDKKFAKLIKKMPKWKPGQIGGKPVRSLIVVCMNMKVYRQTTTSNSEVKFGKTGHVHSRTTVNYKTLITSKFKEPEIEVWHESRKL